MLVGGAVVARGVRQDAERVASAMAAARQGLTVSLESFAANTVEYLRQERDLLLDGVGLPAIRTRLEGRHCLVVVRGHDYRADLAALRPYIREFRPVLIGVDGGADALLEAGHRPDLIVGDMEAVTDAALRCGAELVVHVHPDGRGTGLARANQLNLPAVTLRRGRDQRGSGPAAGRRQGGLAHRGGRHPRHAGGVPRPGPRRHGLDVPDPAAAGRPARRRQGGRARCTGRARRPRRWRCWSRPRWRRWPPPWPRTTVGRPWLDALAQRWDELMVRAPRTVPMINFRFHVLSLTAIFVALAVGLLVGTAALDGPVADGLRAESGRRVGRRAGPHRPAARPGRPADRRCDDPGGVRRAAGPVRAGRPAGRQAGAGRRRRRRPGRCRRCGGDAAGGPGHVVGPVTITDRFVDPLRAQELLDTALTALPPSVSSGLPATTDGVTASAALLAAVLVRRTPPVTADDRRSVLTAYADLGYLAGVDPSGPPADAVVVVGGPATGAGTPALLRAAGRARPGGAARGGRWRAGRDGPGRRRSGPTRARRRASPLWTTSARRTASSWSPGRWPTSWPARSGTTAPARVRRCCPDPRRRLGLGTGPRTAPRSALPRGGGTG